MLGSLSNPHGVSLSLEEKKNRMKGSLKHCSFPFIFTQTLFILFFKISIFFRYKGNFVAKSSPLIVSLK